MDRRLWDHFRWVRSMAEYTEPGSEVGRQFRAELVELKREFRRAGFVVRVVDGVPELVEVGS